MVFTVAAAGGYEDDISIEYGGDDNGGKQRCHEVVFGRWGVNKSEYEDGQVKKAHKDESDLGSDPFVLHMIRDPFCDG